MKKSKIVLLSSLLLVVAFVCTFLAVSVMKNAQNASNERDYKEELLQEIDENAGKFAENKIVLGNTDYGTAKAIAEAIGAKLRTNKDKTYSVITLPDDLSVQDVVNDDKYSEYLAFMSLDRYMQVEDIQVVDEINAAWPQYEINDSLYGNQVNLKYMNIGNTWETNKGKGVKVAVIDSGFDVDHPDLIGKPSIYSYYASQDKIVKDYVLPNGEYDWSLIDDEQGHGTAVAGTICAAMNEIGVTGIAPEVELIVIKCDCDSKNRFISGSDIAFGLYYAIEQEVDIVNMSIGGGGNGLADALQLAVDSDILVVGAAGNDSSDTPSYPAADPNCLGVGALEYDSWDLAWYSNFGINSDIVAPGTVYTTIMGGGYGYIFGTSFACPSAVGAIALLMSQEDHVMTYDEITELIFASCTDLGEKGNDRYFGYGAIDIDTMLHGERGEITFNYLTDELETTKQVFIRGHVLQNIPNPERTYAVFDGWYYDIHCAERLDLYNDRFYSDLTLYARWENEDDGVPYVYVVLDDGTIEIQKYTGKRRYITIPEMIDGAPVTSISSEAFMNEGELRMVNLPSQLKRIGDAAFSGCSNLLNITIPKSVESIGNGAFSSCVRMKEVDIEKDTVLSYIGNGAFTGCMSLKRFTVPATVTYISSSTLSGCMSLYEIIVEEGNKNYTSEDGVLFNISKTTVMTYPAGRAAEEYTLPSSVKIIDAYAFLCAPMARVNVGEIEAIGISAFASSSIEEFDMPDSVISLGQSAFMKCGELKTIKLSEKLTEIPKYTFKYCSALQKIDIPKKVVLILEESFSNTYSLKEITFADDSELALIDLASFFATGIEKITFPSSLIEIERWAFTYSSLYEINFEENSLLKHIGEYAFMGTGPSEVTLPKSLEKIDRAAFGACYALQNVFVEEGSETFKSVDGVLYSLDEKSLYVYGAGRTAGEYTVLPTTEVIEEGAFYGVMTLEKVNFSDVLTTISKHAFYNCRNIPAYEFPETLTFIEEFAFSENVSLESVALPASIYQISNCAFANDTKLASVTIDNGTKLPRLSYGAFMNTAIETFRVPASVSTMAQGVFENCANLREIVFEDNSRLEYIAAFMFNGCDKLESIDFGTGSSLKNIEAHAFEGMSKIRTIDFKDAAIENIDNFAFRYCESLESITLPDTVEYIGRYSFFMCKKLSQLGIPVAVKDIGEYAFYGTDKINIFFKADTLPKGLRENWDYGILCYYVGVDDLIENDDYKYAVLNNGNVSIIKYKGNETALDLNIFTYGTIESIGGEAFTNTAVKEVVLPNGVKSILMYAFNYSDIETINIPASVEFIGRYSFAASKLKQIDIAENSNLYKIEQYAFAYCPDLESIALPASLETMGSYVFYESGLESVTFAPDIKLIEIPEYAFFRTKLASLALPDGLTLINHNAFREISTLESVTFGTGKLYIMANVFYHSGLKSIYIPENVEYIGEYAFVALHDLESFEVSENNKYYKSVDGLLYTKNGRKLISVPGKLEGKITLPLELEVIGFGAFEDSKLTEVEFNPNSNILTFGYRAFYNTQNLKEITVPKSVVSVDFYAFAQCVNLEKVTFQDDGALNGIYEGAFYGCRKLSDIELPDVIYEISDYAFAGCLSLDHIPVKETTKLMGIYDHAFDNSGVENVVIPDSVIDIGDYAFKNCKIKSIVIPMTNVEDLEIGIGAFEGCIEMKELTIPFIGRKLRGDSRNYIGYVFGAGAYEANNTYLPASLEKITITYPITELSEGAFYGCENLKEIVLPDTIRTIGRGSFGNTTAKYELKNPISFACADRSISNYDIGHGIVGKLSFADDDITNVVINECPYLVEIVYPDSMERFEGSLNYCYSLKYVTFGTGLKSVKDAVLGGWVYTTLDTLTNNSDLVLGFDWAPNFRRIINKDGTVLYKEDDYEFALDGPFKFLHTDGKYYLIDYTGDETEITLPESILGNSYEILLEGNGKIETVIVPETFTKIGENAFRQCIALKKVVLPDTITEIGKQAFYQCENLVEISIPYGVEEIPYKAFDRCSSLKTIDLPSSIKYIQFRAFYICPSLESIVLPEGIKFVYDEAFSGCTSLSSVYIPNSLTDWVQNAFISLPSLKEITFENPDNFTIIDGIVYNKELTKMLFIPTMKEGHITVPESVTSMEFNGCEKITGVTLPSTLEVLPGFAGCKSITELVIPDTITEIGGWNFTGCDSLTKLTLPSGLKTFPNYMTIGCNAIKELVIPEGVERIEGVTLPNVTRLVIPSTVTYIHKWALNDCPRLLEVVNLSDLEITAGPEGDITARAAKYISKDLNDSIYTDTDDGFRFIKNDKGDWILYSYIGYEEEIVLPSELNGEPITYSIDSHCFEYDGFIRKVTIPGCVTSVYPWAFSTCRNLEEVIVESGVTEIAAHAFENCTKLAKVTLPDTITRIGECAFNETAIMNDEKNFPDGILYIGNNLVRVNPESERVVIREGITCIADRAFDECFKVKEVRIGGSHYGMIAKLVNLERIVLTSMPDHLIAEYFAVGWNDLRVPITLREVVLENDCVIRNTNHFDYLGNITIYTLENELDFEMRAKNNQWHGGYTVYYGEDWNYATFRDESGKIIDTEIYLNTQVLRIPYYLIDSDEMYDYTLAGWDVDGDGVVDNIPANIVADTDMTAVVEKEKHVYTITFLNKDGSVYMSYGLNYGDTIEKPDDPQLKGYEFNGWVGYFDGMKVTGDETFMPFFTHIGGGHDFVYTETVGSTCTEGGYNAYICSICDELKKEYTSEPLGHDYSVTVVQPKCEEQGYTLHRCSVCNDEYKDTFTDALGHSFGEWETVTEATCTKSGEKRHICAACSAEETAQIELKGHTFVELDREDSTCAHKGHVHYKCSVCNAEYTEELPVTEHDYVKIKAKKTWFMQLIEFFEKILFGYEGNDVYYYRCANCGEYKLKDESEDMVGASAFAAKSVPCKHEHTTLVEVVKPTATEDGINAYVCDLCGEAVGLVNEGTHTYDNDCDTTCNVCGYTREVTHNYVRKYDDNIHWSECSVCGARTGESEHTLDEKGKCTECGFEKSILADLSGDGNIDTMDLTLLRKYLAGYTITGSLNAADLNGDGKVDTIDLTLLRKYLAGYRR